MRSPEQSPVTQSLPIALSERAHERVGDRRTDDAWLEETWADPSTRVLMLAGAKFPATENAVGWVAPADAPDGQRIFLGRQKDVAHFAVLVDPKNAPEEWVSFRRVVQTLSTGDAGLLAHAVALAEWHQAHRHCPRCGGVLEAAQAGHVLTCAQCGKQQFPRTDPAVIMVVTDGERCLLGRHEEWPEGRYSTLAGFVEPGESLEDAVRREVAEEVGVEIGEVSYFGNQPWPFPASLMVGFVAHALTTEIDVDGDEISDARWFTRTEMKEEAESGTLILPGGISISRSLVESWYGAPLPGQW